MVTSCLGADGTWIARIRSGLPWTGIALRVGRPGGQQTL